MRRALAHAIAATMAAVTALTSCAGGPRDHADTRPSVVASTDVWGSVAQSVAGDDARVTSIVHGTMDPHSYDPAPTAVAAIEDATLVVYNGGGYDAWVDEVLDNYRAVPAINAYSLLDAARIGEAEPANEHVFYELDTARAVADRVAERLSEADPAHGDRYRSRAAEFGRKATAILEREHALRTEFPGSAVVATEPVAHYLLLTAGLTDKTPHGFANAVEQDTDPAPVDMAAVLDLITEGRVSVLVFNDQTVTGATRQVRDAAQRSAVPVVAVTETLPGATDYLTWQADVADRLATALRETR